VNAAKVVHPRQRHERGEDREELWGVERREHHRNPRAEGLHAVHHEHHRAARGERARHTRPWIASRRGRDLERTTHGLDHESRCIELVNVHHQHRYAKMFSARDREPRLPDPARAVERYGLPGPQPARQLGEQGLAAEQRLAGHRGPRLSLVGGLEAVPDPGHSEQVPRAGRVGFDLAPEPMDGREHRAGARVGGVPPDMLQKFGLGHRSSRVCREVDEQPGFDGGEALVAPLDGARSEVNFAAIEEQSHGWNRIAPRGR
jgi:hypothetical protein